MPDRDGAVRIAATILALTLCGCIDEPGVEPLVFSDSFVGNQYQRFGDALGEIVADPSEKISGFASLKVTVPSDGCPGADTTHFCYAGGALVATAPRDLSGYDMLTFWAKASVEGASIAQVGFGNDNTGLSKFTAAANNVPLSTAWAKYYLPIPLPSRLTAERGLFYFAVANLGGVGFDLWFDAVQFEKAGPAVLGPPRPSIPGATVNRKVGSSIALRGGMVTWAVNGVDQTMVAMPSYFTWTSSNPDVATVDEGGTGVARAFGVTDITASLGSVPAEGTYQVTVPGGGVPPVPQQVFTDGFVDTDFQAFDTALGTIAVSTAEHHSGTASLRIIVPDDGCPGAGANRFCYTGGAFVAGVPQDLSLFNALTFWAKATNPAAQFDVAGLGNDNSANSIHTASVNGLKLTTAWAKYWLPIPAPAKLASERGLFYFAASNIHGTGYDIFIDDLQFENVDASVLGAPRPFVPAASITRPPGSTFKPGAATVTFPVNGADLVMSVMPATFDWASSNPAVATVGPDGTGAAVGPGSATITATLGGIPAGQISVFVPGGTTTGGPLVFNDDFVDDGFQAFGNALGTVAVDTAEQHAGIASLRIDVPSDGCPGSDTTHFCYAGGAVVANSPRDLSGYNVLSFWAKASVPAQFDLVGMGNDNTGTSKYTASWNGPQLGTTWAKYYLPIPLPAKVVAEKGLFFFAAGNQAGTGYRIWVDDVQFESVEAPVLGPPRPALPNISVNAKLGAPLSVSATVTFAVNGFDQLINPAPAWFTWSSSDPSVAPIDADGTGVAAAFGTATLTASLGDTPAAGTLTVVVPGGSTPPGPLQIFTDGLIATDFQSFDTALGTLQLTTAQSHSGTTALQAHVPSNGCIGADTSHFCYAGGAFVAAVPQDLTPFNALTFWAKATNAAAKFDQAGLGNDNTGHSKYTVTASNLALTTAWKKYFIPIPLAEKLTAERGMFWFAASNVSGTGYDIFIDDVQFELTGAGVIGAPQPSLASATVSKIVLDTFPPPAATVTFAVNGVPLALGALPSYFTWASSNTAVVTVGSDGAGLAVGSGAATVTATLGTVAATGALTVNVK